MISLFQEHQNQGWREDSMTDFRKLWDLHQMSRVQIVFLECEYLRA